MQSFNSDFFSGNGSAGMSFFSSKLYKRPEWYVEEVKAKDKIKSLRANLAAGIAEMLRQNDLSLTEASLQAKLPKPTVSAIYKGKIDKFSTDRLMFVALTLGLKVSLKIGSAS